MALRRETHPQKGCLYDTVCTVLGWRDPEAGHERWAPLEENQRWRCRDAALAPESNQIFPIAEGLVENSVGDFSISPFLDLGLGAPPAVAHREPKLAVVFAKRNEPFRCAGEAGDLGRREEGENAELDVLGEIGERNGTTQFINCETCVFDRRHFWFGIRLDFPGKFGNFLGKKIGGKYG